MANKGQHRCRNLTQPWVRFEITYKGQGKEKKIPSKLTGYCYLLAVSMELKIRRDVHRFKAHIYGRDFHSHTYVMFGFFNCFPISYVLLSVLM